MADNTPNYTVEIQRVVMQLAQFRWNREKQLLENMELLDRIETNKENIEATGVALADYEERLRELQETHGDAVAGKEKDNG